jgi:hypothetical protein
MLEASDGNNSANRQLDRPGGCEIDDEIKFGRLLDSSIVEV